MTCHLFALLCLAIIWSESDCICLVPNKDILDACKVGQLSIITHTNMNIRNQDLCNREISKDFLNQKWNIRIENYFTLEFTKNTTFTLVMIDVTSNKLLWMMSNISSTNGDITTTQNPYNHHVVTVRDFTSPSFIRESPQATHLIQVFVFQEDNSGAVYPRPQADPFYIRDWLMQSQAANSKSIMCGPVAGIQFKINQSPLSKDYKSMGNFVYSVAPSRGNMVFQSDKLCRVEYFVILFIVLSCY